MRRLLKMTVFMTLALALAFAFVGVKDASADALLFPWITKSSTVSTLVSVVNTTNIDGAAAPDQLHYQYWYKRTTANSQTESCDAVSFRRPITENDIVTFDASGNINSGNALFSDSTAGSDTYKLDVSSPRRAFLLVDNNTSAVNKGVGDADGTMYGEAMVLEIAGGAAWGYIAYNATQGSAADAAAVFFPDGADQLGEVIGDAEVTQTVLMPPGTITTRFFTTPVDTTNQRVGTANTRVQLCVSPTVAGGCNQGGVFDNDENKIDFEKVKNIVCTSADDLSSLMTEGGYNSFVTTAGQGWTYITTSAGTIDANGDAVADNPETGIIIGKLEFTTAGITISGTSVPGTLNNFNWLRDSETVITGLGGTSSGNNVIGGY